MVDFAFLRLVTNPAFSSDPSPWRRRGIRWTGGWTAPWIPQPTQRHRKVLGDLLRSHGGRANLVPDAHLAALAIDHGLVLCSSNSDFARFPGLRWVNPLTDPAALD